MADLTQEFSERIAAATAPGNNGPLCIRGGGSKDFYGGPLTGEILDTRGHTGIVAYEPTELVITARCGTSLAEIEAVLAEQNQFLAFEPPHWGNATVGGVVAAGLSGPRRASAGAVRDFVLGVNILDGTSRRLTFGGTVMKNVAGYDVSRLMAGSLGTLGLILEVSLKVLPRPVAEATLRFELPQDKALEVLNAWAGRPLPISANCWHDDVLTLRLSGAQAAVDAARRTLGGEEVADAASFWNGLREQHHAFFAGPDHHGPLWRLSLPSTTPPLAGDQLIEWGGAQRWLRGGDPAAMRDAANRAGGHATLFRATDKSAGAFQPLSLPLMQIHQRLKAAFDPRGVFNPGRLYPNL